MAYFIQTINGYLWGFPMIAFLFCTHIFMSVRTGFVQKNVLRGIRLSMKGSDKEKGELSPFSCLATSLASTLGTGNIIGVGTAVALGGAGAVFWCWITGVFGMATQYGECMLAVRYRTKSKDGLCAGGPMYVLSQGVGSKSLGAVYAFLAAVCGLITGAAIQTNSISAVITQYIQGHSLARDNQGVKCIPILVGVVGAGLAAVVIFGGVRSIGKVCSFLVPFMALVYTLGCVAVLVINGDVLGKALALIIKEAFSLRSVGAGASGYVMMLSCRYGMARGLFSNEAGLGTSSVVSACARTDSPVKQGMIAMTATFWDTVVMCLVTGLVIVSTILKNPDLTLSDGGALCLKAFALIPYIGELILVFSMVTFAFSTVLGWSLVGEKCAEFVFGHRITKPYRLMWILCVLLSPMVSLGVVWDFGDLINALLVIPNVTALVILSKEVRNDTKEYLK